MNQQLLSYLEQHQGTTEYLLAVGSSTDAAPYIIQTGKPVMSLGGFSGSNPILTVAKLQTLIKDNVVRYFIVGGMGNSSLSSYIESACTLVPSSAYQTSSSSSTTHTTSSTSSSTAATSSGSSQQLYYCGTTTSASK